MATTAAAQAATIKAPNFQRQVFAIRGSAPLVLHRFSAKVKEHLRQKMEEGTPAHNKKRREARDTDDLFNQARYRSKEGWDGFHAASVRNGCNKMRLVYCLFLAVALCAQTAQVGPTTRVGPTQMLGASGGGTVHTCGNIGTPTSGNGSNANFAMGPDACVPPSNATVQDCVLNIFASTGGHVNCAIYASSAGSPTGSPLCSSSSVVSAVGVNTLTLSGCGTLSSGSRYFIIANTDSNGTGWGVLAGGPALNGKFQASTYPAFPSGAWTGDATVQNFTFYLDIIY